MTEAVEPEAPAAESLPDERPVYVIAKRVLDVSISFAVLMLFAPLWGLMWLAVRLTSPGPVLHRLHREVGKNGREFTMYKVRTMYHNSDNAVHKRAYEHFVKGQPLSYVNEGGVRRPVYKMVDDPRITPVGRVLRKTGLDEVPQFLNVLRGEMSVVGPRAAQHYEYELYTKEQRKRLSVLPGITGFYQVTARSEVPFDRMVELDLEYIARRSLWLDLWIILKTPGVMLTGRGAH